jgi:hypothetical protein
VSIENVFYAVFITGMNIFYQKGWRVELTRVLTGYTKIGQKYIWKFVSSLVADFQNGLVCDFM